MSRVQYKQKSLKKNTLPKTNNGTKKSHLSKGKSSFKAPFLRVPYYFLWGVEA